MSTHLPCFSHFSGFLHRFELAKLANSSIQRIKNFCPHYKEVGMELSVQKKGWTGPDLVPGPDHNFYKST